MRVVGSMENSTAREHTLIKKVYRNRACGRTQSDSIGLRQPNSDASLINNL